MIWLPLLSLTACDLEVPDTGVPLDCEERQLFYVDADGDGVGQDSLKIIACEQPEGAVSVGGDCDDSDPEHIDDCPEFALSTLCDGAGPSLQDTPSFSDPDYPQCPDPMVLPELSWQAPDVDRYALGLLCTVQASCAQGDTSAMELSCEGFGGYFELDGQEVVDVEVPLERSVVLVDPYASLPPELMEGAQFGLVLAGQGQERWLAAYDETPALRMAWAQSGGELEPPEDLLTALGLAPGLWWGALQIAPATEICPWEDDTERARLEGLILSMGDDGAQIGSSTWAGLGAFRAHAGLLRMSLDGESERTLLVTGL